MLSQDVSGFDGVKHLRVTVEIEQGERVVSVCAEEVSAEPARISSGSPTRGSGRRLVASRVGRRRLQLSRLLVAEPSVLVLDEPMNGHVDRGLAQLTPA
ncbi:hypothetical protein [uncultured Arthrobacter sp.]|uniref:hypothetical protein n=1 Tax=uncultured Arthrobacter sp. TaxID=114050 RepID=UPI00260341CF|nr:hypothetical protein [uncultured Arthrobacter sp.]